MSDSPAGLAAALKDAAAGLGFAAAGITSLRPSDHADHFRIWLADGHHANMAWLARGDAVERRCDPRAAWPELRSALVIADDYLVDPREQAPGPSRGIVARYARGRDYHNVIKPKLLRLLRWLENETGRRMPEARVYVDTGPVLERELARRAGLGWFGRNTMLIHPRRGSYFFLGCLLLPLDLPEDEPFIADHCGTCNACIDACPTDALLGRNDQGAPVLDANRCISYLTIEHRDTIPADLRPLMSNRIFGCDICQEVCPWNGSVRIRHNGDGKTAGRGTSGHARELVELLGMSEAEWEDLSRGSAIRRAGRSGFLRSVAVALGNGGARSALQVLESALDDPDPTVRDHAAWALERIESQSH